MQSRETERTPKIRIWIATALVVLVVIALWRFIDYRTQPPPPPNLVAPGRAP
jgi:hypothetical protein